MRLTLFDTIKLRLSL